MPLIKKFEDIIAWQEARKLVAGIYRLTSSSALAKDYGLRDQILRTVIGVFARKPAGSSRSKVSVRAVGGASTGRRSVIAC